MRARWFVRLVAVVGTLVVVPVASGRTPVRQGELTNLYVQTVEDGEHVMSFALFSEAEGGVLLWQQKQVPVEVRGGGFSVVLGNQGPMDVDTEDLWLEVTIHDHLLEPGAKSATDGSISANVLKIRDPASGGWWSEMSMGAGGLVFKNWGGSKINFMTGADAGTVSSRMLIRDTGEVYIGYNPGAQLGQLDVAGRTYITNGTDAGTAAGTGYLVIGDETQESIVIDDNEIMARDGSSTSTLYLQHNGGEVWVNNLYHASDARLKKDIRGLESGLDEVMRLRPVSFLWADGDDGPRLGLVAQEVRGVVDEVVFENDEGMLGVAYENLVPVLVKAIQEQQAQSEKQQAQIDRLTAELDELRRQRDDS